MRQSLNQLKLGYKEVILSYWAVENQKKNHQKFDDYILC